MNSEVLRNSLDLLKLRERTIGEALCLATKSFIDVQEELGNVVAMMRSQGYNSAANIIGMHSGLQAQIRQQIRRAIYMHSKGHNGRLAIGHALSLWREAWWTHSNRSPSASTTQLRGCACYRLNWS